VSGARTPRRERLRSVLATLLVALIVGAAAGQEAVCRDRLERAAERVGSPPDRIATAVVRAAFEALEPAYPARRGEGTWSDPNAAWLHRRGVLPDGWREDRLDVDAWRALLARLQEPYGVEPREVSGRLDRATLVREATAALAAGADAVRPLAMFAYAKGDRTEVEFAGVIWNWTPHPRLLLFRPDDLRMTEEGRPGPALQELGTCAWRSTGWVAANIDAAVRYYFGNVESGLIVLATDRDVVRREVPRGEERTVLRFDWPPLEGAEIASLEFTGPGPGISEGISLLTQLRTNLGLFDLREYMVIP
jgi:hypothetical protein